MSEALALRWRDVGLDGRPCVKVPRAVVNGRIGKPKSKNGKRDVPISQQLVAALRQQLQRATRTGPDDVIFACELGTPHRPENIRRELVPLAEEAGVGWFGFHGLRHHYVSRLIELGLNIVQISRVIGHAKASFTLDVYAHLLDDHVGEALDLEDVTPPPEAVEAAVEHLLRQEESA
jgi:integrase